MIYLSVLGFVLGCKNSGVTVLRKIKFWVISEHFSEMGGCQKVVSDKIAFILKSLYIIYTLLFHWEAYCILINDQ